MEERTTLERTYVTRDEYEANNRLIDEKFNRVLTVIEKNFELTNEKIEHVVDTFTVAINGTNNRIDSLEKRFDDMRQTMSLWFTVFGLLVVAVPIAVAVVQAFVNK